MINNFSVIADIIRRKSSVGEFYFLQILKRRKDNPDLYRDMVLVDNFFIKGAEDLLNKEEIIINVCERNNARAYFRLNKRSYEKVALQTLRLIAENIASKQYDIKNCYLSACGQFHSDDNKTWNIDVDNFDEKQCDRMRELISVLPPAGEKLIAKIYTQNGYHLISRPFRLDVFKQCFPGVSVHKDNPTILYIP